MRKIIFVALLMITSIATFAQNKEILHNQFSDYVQFRKDHQPNHQYGFRPEFGPHRFPMNPKPLSVTVKKNVVIVVFKKEDFLKLRPMVRERVLWKQRPQPRMERLFKEKMEH